MCDILDTQARTLVVMGREHTSQEHVERQHTHFKGAGKGAGGGKDQAGIIFNSG